MSSYNHKNLTLSMRYLIFGTLALLLFLSQTTLAQKWEQLDPTDVNGSESPTARELLDVATNYVKQKGMFESTKYPFPGNYYKGGYGHNDDTTFERRNTSTVTYYRYNFTLTEQFGTATVNATAIVSYNPSNSNFVVTNYSYHINYHGQEAEPNHGTPGYHESLTDTRTLTGDGDLASDVNECFDSVIADHIEQGTIPDAKYTIQYVYGAWMQRYDGDKETNVNEEGEINEEGELNEEQVEEEGEEAVIDEDYEGVIDEEEGPVGPTPAYKFYDIYLKVKSSEGKYYYLLLEINYTKENGEFVLDKSTTLGDFKSLE